MNIKTVNHQLQKNVLSITCHTLPSSVIYDFSNSFTCTYFFHEHYVETLKCDSRRLQPNSWYLLEGKNVYTGT
jgi:hypothetical protein